jgi:hypothetical protein
VVAEFELSLVPVLELSASVVYPVGAIGGDATL